MDSSARKHRTRMPSVLNVGHVSCRLVIGCPDMKSSQALQWRRTSHVTSLVTCTNTSGSRELVCQGNKWSNGAINCSSPVAVKDFPSITETAKGDNSTALSYGLSLTIITALTFAIGTVILCAGLIVAKKCKSSCLISSIIDHTIDNQFNNTNLSSNQYGSIDDNKYQDGHFHDIKISQFTSLASPNAALVCSMSKFNPAHRIHPHPSNAVATATKILGRCCHGNGEWTSSQLLGGTSFNARDWTRPPEVKQMEERNFTGCKYHLRSNRLHGNLVPLPPATSSCHHGLWKESQLDLDSSPNVVPPIAGSQKCIIDQFHINSTPIHMNRRPITNKNNNNNVNNNSNVGDDDEHHHIYPHLYPHPYPHTYPHPYPHPHPHSHRQQHNHVYPQLVCDFGSSIDEGQGREGLI